MAIHKEGYLVKHLRDKKEISQQELANEVGVAQSYISDIEKNLKTPRPPVLGKLGKILGFTIGEFFEGKKV